MHNKKNRLILFIEYTLVFLCLLATFFFILPSEDNYAFGRMCDNSLDSIVDYAINYGNGRILGNILGVFFSHFFEYTAVFVAICITITIALLNHLIFNNSRYAVFTIALLVTFPSLGIVDQAYTLPPMFINFFTPITIALISFCIYKYLNNNCTNIVVKILLNIILFILGVASCLFSENTSLVIATISLIIIVYSLFTKAKIKFHSISHLISVILGTITLLIFPHIIGSSHKMDGYRETVSSLSELINIPISNFLSFSNIFCSFTLLITILSFVLICTVISQNSDIKFKPFCISFLAVFPFFCLIIDSTVGYPYSTSSSTSIFKAPFVIIYLLIVLYILFKINQKNKKIFALCGYIVLLSAIVPMLFVRPFNYRTNLTTYFVLLLLTAFILKNTADLGKIFSHIKKCFNKKILAYVMCIIFVFSSAYTGVQILTNYNFYVVRSKYIIQEINTGNEEIKVPILPYSSVTYEDNCGGFTVQLASEKTKKKIRIVPIYECQNAEEYDRVFSNFVFTNLKLALDNLEFRSSSIIDNALNNN